MPAPQYKFHVLDIIQRLDPPANHRFLLLEVTKVHLSSTGPTIQERRSRCVLLASIKSIGVINGPSSLA